MVRMPLQECASSQVCPPKSRADVDLGELRRPPAGGVAETALRAKDAAAAGNHPESRRARIPQGSCLTARARIVAAVTEQRPAAWAHGAADAHGAEPMTTRNARVTVPGNTVPKALLLSYHWPSMTTPWSDGLLGIVKPLSAKPWPTTVLVVREAQG